MTENIETTDSFVISNPGDFFSVDSKNPQGLQVQVLKRVGDGYVPAVTAEVEPNRTLFIKLPDSPQAVKLHFLGSGLLDIMTAWGVGIALEVESAGVSVEDATEAFSRIRHLSTEPPLPLGSDYYH